MAETGRQSERGVERERERARARARARGRGRGRRIEGEEEGEGERERGRGDTGSARRDRLLQPVPARDLFECWRCVAALPRASARVYPYDLCRLESL